MVWLSFTLILQAWHGKHWYYASSDFGFVASIIYTRQVRTRKNSKQSPFFFQMMTVSQSVMVLKCNVALAHTSTIARSENLFKKWVWHLFQLRILGGMQTHNWNRCHAHLLASCFDLKKLHLCKWVWCCTWAVPYILGIMKICFSGQKFHFKAGLKTSWLYWLQKRNTKIFFKMRMLWK